AARARWHRTSAWPAAFSSPFLSVSACRDGATFNDAEPTSGEACHYEARPSPASNEAGPMPREPCQSPNAVATHPEASGGALPALRDCFVAPHLVPVTAVPARRPCGTRCGAPRNDSRGLALPGFGAASRSLSPKPVTGACHQSLSPKPGIARPAQPG